MLLRFFLCLIVSVFLYPVYAEFPTASPQVILLYGTSCAGKSTLGRELQKDLGADWQILDWDDFANEFGDENATGLLLATILQTLADGNYLIVDTQSCVDFDDALVNYNVATILVYTSLNTLIARDEARQTLLKRPEKKRRYARAYIYETYFQLFACEPNNDFIDTITSEHIEEGLFNYPLHEDTYDFFSAIAQSTFPISIFTRRPFNLIIRTDQNDVFFSLDLIKSRLF